MFLGFRKRLGQLEKRTFYLHLAYSIIEGIILGVLALNEFVFLKSLKGSNVQVGLLFQASVFVLVFSVVLNEWLNRVKNKQRFILITAILTRIPLLFLIFFPSGIGEGGVSSLFHYLFLLIFLIYYFATPIIYPVINLFLKTNYTHKNFSILYSYATTINKLVMLVVTFLYGLLLDFDDQSYRIVFPFIGILGIISVYLFSRIRYKTTPLIFHNSSVIKSISSTWKNMRKIMKGNIAFRDFETGFMFYGFAFMGTVSVITIFYEKGLGLNYSSVAFYKNSYNLLAIILLPFMGKLLGRIDPRKFAAITFASLLFYLLFTLLTEYFPVKTEIAGIQIYYSLFLAMMFNGVFAATMSLLWSIGSAYFCSTEESSNYQAIHLSFTGLRSFFAPLLGVLFYQWLGFTGTFLIGIGLLLIAILISLRNTKIGIKNSKDTIIIHDP
jgi:MFS family permease